MIEIVIKEYLESVLSVPVYLVIPVDPPATYVSIEKTGGAIPGLIFMLFYENLLTYVSICGIISLLRDTDQQISWQWRKGENMEGMTDNQFSKILEMVLMILDGCKDLDEAKEKIKKLAGNDK